MTASLKKPPILQQIWRISLIILGILLVLDVIVLMMIRQASLLSLLSPGLLLPLLIGLIFLVHGFAWPSISHYLAHHAKLKRLWHLMWGLFWIWLASFLVFCWLLSQQMTHTNTAPPVKAIIVLGSGIKDGKPTQTLAYRLDSAAHVLMTQPQTLVILSGGHEVGERDSEAQVMANYLREHYPVGQATLALEDQSTSTELNLLNSQPILAAHHITLNDPIALVTSDFHTLRSAAIARKQGYQHPIMVASPTPLAVRYNSWLREYFAFISGWLLDEY